MMRVVLFRHLPPWEQRPVKVPVTHELAKRPAAGMRRVHRYRRAGNEPFSLTAMVPLLKTQGFCAPLLRLVQRRTQLGVG
jgi:hypothetical protein